MFSLYNRLTVDHTRYNSLDHPVAFHKADDLSKAPKKLVAEQLPDLEEAFEVRTTEIHNYSWIIWIDVYV